MPEGEVAIQALGVNWRGVAYQLIFFTMMAVFWRFPGLGLTTPLVSVGWRTLGRVLCLTFVAAIAAGSICGAGSVVTNALVWVVVAAGVIGSVVLRARLIGGWRGGHD